MFILNTPKERIYRLLIVMPSGSAGEPFLYANRLRQAAMAKNCVFHKRRRYRPMESESPVRFLSAGMGCGAISKRASCPQASM